ncbi:hypothetical protein SAMN05216296_1955 [Pseudomonas pohangensis]|uniref:Lipoprotein n=1 Tax=Pseudomonas pohangensis TaxID=364197 RepID=A0A1H2G0R4_9PSED|nr:hypothetical protein [Pseudomonas pohangensis]SDU13176.1 hypothetical protein SAMN05216296_1955 [Pseudomonas pohangensis]
MSMRKTLISAFIMASVTGSALMLTGCSGGPSDSEVSEAFKAGFEREMKPLAALSKMTGVAPPELVDVNNLGCAERKPSGYVCDVEIEMKSRGTVQKSVHKLDFVKGSDGWVIQG